MSVFLHQFIKNKKFILIILSVVLLFGFLFGFYQYSHTNALFKDFFQNFFYLHSESYENHYQLYMIQSALLMIISTYLSTSYLGHVGLLAIMFLKGLQFSFSLSYVFSQVQIDFVVFIFMLTEIILELSILYILLYMSIYLSVYVTLVTFFIEQNFYMKNILNYRLNFLIATLICLALSLAFRLYIVTMF